MTGLIGRIYASAENLCGGKLVNVIKSMYVNSEACVRLKGAECECFKIESDVR